MKVKDFIKVDRDIDVYDDYDERLGIAFCYGYRLTPEGERHFHKALEMEIEVIDKDTAIVHCETAMEANRAKKFFDSLAGFCPAREFDTWFEWIE